MEVTSFLNKPFLYLKDNHQVSWLFSALNPDLDPVKSITDLNLSSSGFRIFRILHFFPQRMRIWIQSIPWHVLTLSNLRKALFNLYIEKSQCCIKELTGNDKYEGFLVDMLDATSDILGARFNIHIVKDGKSMSAWFWTFLL